MQQLYGTCLRHYRIHANFTLYTTQHYICTYRMYMVYEQWLNVLLKQGVFFHCKRKCARSIYTAVGHSLRLGSSASLAGRALNRKGSLLSTETQINCVLNQINAHLKWAVSLNRLKLSIYNRFEFSTQRRLHSIHQCFVLFADVYHKQRRRWHIIRDFLSTLKGRKLW